MKKVLIGSFLAISVAFSAQSFNIQNQSCVENLEDEIKFLVSGYKKDISNDIVNRHIKNQKTNSKTISINAKKCIQNFEETVLKIINENPTYTNKEETKQIMMKFATEQAVVKSHLTSSDLGADPKFKLVFLGL
jgi:hypothetical protein